MQRSLVSAILNGIRCRCPRCGVGSLYAGFLQTPENCAHCGLHLSGHRADDAPPYVVLFIVGHVVVGLMLSAEKLGPQPMWTLAAIWLPAALIMSLALIRPVKGALIGIQWANAMHGFSKTPEHV